MHPRNAGEFFFSSPHVTPQQDKLLFFNPAHIPATALYFFFFLQASPQQLLFIFLTALIPATKRLTLSLRLIWCDLGEELLDPARTSPIK
jgi:hypothetical protein